MESKKNEVQKRKRLETTNGGTNQKTAARRQTLKHTEGKTRGMHTEVANK